jgi:hypothetical protein
MPPLHHPQEIPLTKQAYSQPYPVEPSSGIAIRSYMNFIHHMQIYLAMQFIAYYGTFRMAGFGNRSPLKKTRRGGIPWLL